MSVAPKHRQLPDKESKLFKELLTQYELKQYKKGLKAADTILKKFPNHGETLALKALTIYSSIPYPVALSGPKQTEAEELARTAVKKDITSHITWHVLGILAKNRKDYEEASRAFGMARKQDPDNIPLLRDSMSLYLHTRQYESAVQVRHHFLTLRPQLRSTWLGLVVAHHLNGDIPAALEVYDGLQSCQNKEGGTAPERAQTYLYVIKMCIEQGEYEDALRRLEAGIEKKIISPRGEVTQLKAEILLKLERTGDAQDSYRELLKQNPDNLEYYRGLLKTEGLDITQDLTEEERTSVLKRLNDLKEAYPRSTAPKRLSLVIATGETFRQLVQAYVVAGLEKGVPSLFVDVKGLYTDAGKMAVVGEVVEEIVQKLEKDTLHDDGSIPPPTTLLWAYYFLALHLAHPKNANASHPRALDLLQKALDHTPTLPEIYMARAMVLKRAGDPLGAAYAMEEARLLDGQDRFLNGKAAKYWLRAGDVKKAEELLAMFTKKDMTAPADLTEMQCLWFLEESGDCHRRNGNLAMALKRYQALATVFRDYEDDQYDFHQYCLRRMTLGAYVDLMRYEDELRSHPNYFSAVLSAIDIYVRIHDKPDLKEEKLTPEEEADRKRAAKKAQKAEQKAKKAAALSSDGKKDDAPAPDDDPDGNKLLKTETPLEDAYKLWKPLEKHAARRLETWTKGYEIYIRKGMYLAALKCLNEAAAIDKDAPDLHRQIIHFQKIVNTTELPTLTKAVVEKSFKLLSTSPAEFNKTYLSSNSNSTPHILGAAQGALELEPPASSTEILSILEGLLSTGVNGSPSVADLQGAVDTLERAGGNQEQVNAFKAKCHERLPLAWVFASEEEKAGRQLELQGQVPQPQEGGDGVKAVKADV